MGDLFRWHLAVHANERGVAGQREYGSYMVDTRIVVAGSHDLWE